MLDILLLRKDLASAVARLETRKKPQAFLNVEAFQALESDSEYDPSLCFVAVGAGKVVGFCHGWRMPFIKDLVVAPAWRGRGLARALVTLALETFKARGAASVDLKTDIDNEKAQSLYRRLRFVVVERVD